MRETTLKTALGSSNRRRSQRVVLQISVIVEAEIDTDKPVRLNAFTLVVNAHGGLLEIDLPLRPGQNVTLILPASGLRKRSRIVGFRRSHDTGFLVAFEFDSPTPPFWPLDFPPADWKPLDD
jgi:hypothetical protein